MLKIGITGGIGCGKSVVTGLFAQLGVPVFDSDVAARNLIDTDQVIRRELTEAFGPEAYLPGQQGLNRKKIAQLVFKDQQALERLNKITHPGVIQAAQAWITAQQEAYGKQKARQQEFTSQGQLKPGLQAARPVSYLIKEAALLFETGTNQSLDFILGVYADKNIRIERVLKRDQLTRQDVENRMQKQMDEQQKMALCDGVLINSGQQLLWPQVMAWHKKFMQQGDQG